LKPTTKHYLLTAFWGAVGAFIASVVILTFENRRKNDFDLAMALASDAINRTLPMMIDSATQLMATAGAGGILQYNLRLIHLAAARVDTVSLKQQFQTKVTTSACSAPELRDTFLKRGVTVRFTYADSGFRRLFRIDVSPRDCGF